jgi:hypothetical protein
MGYGEAMITTGSSMIRIAGMRPILFVVGFSSKLFKEVRNNDRVIWQTNDDYLVPLWDRIKDHVEQSITIWGREWKPYGLNERLRFYRCKFFFFWSFAHFVLSR